MKTALLLLTLAAGLSSRAHAYPSGCQNDGSHGAFIQAGANSHDRLYFSSLAVCEKQMAQLKAQPSSVVCGCHDTYGIGSLFSLLGGLTAGKKKDVTCHRVTYSEQEKTYALEEVKIKNNPWPKPYQILDFKPKKYHNPQQQSPDKQVLQDCVKDEALYFEAFNGIDSSQEVVEAIFPADARN